MKKFIIKKASKKGKGLFANKGFKKGKKIFHVDLTKLKSYTRKEVSKHPQRDSDHWDYVGRGRYVITYHPYSYMNHSCNPSCYIKHQTMAIGNTYAMRDIKKGEELTYDYGVNAMDMFGKNYWFNCHCGSKKCRKKIFTDFFKQPLEIQRKYYRNLPPSIRRRYKDKLTKLKK